MEAAAKVFGCRCSGARCYLGGPRLVLASATSLAGAVTPKFETSAGS